MSNQQNPLGTQPIGKLLARYAIPSVVSMVVMAIYNIVDQIYIGHDVGYLGNAATNVAFPLTLIALGIALLFGAGAAAFSNLEMGRGNNDKLRTIVGSSITMITICGVLLTAVVLIFLRPLLTAMGATPDIMPYAIDYTSILALGFPFAMLNTGLAHIIRSDGSPRYSMLSTLTGALLNVVLDPIFIFVFGWEVRGAAWATIISQIASALMSILYIAKYTRNYRLERADFKPQFPIVRRTAAFGSSNFLNQISIFAVNVVLNNSMKVYGALSVYGAEVPLAAMGIVTKINSILISCIIGITIGAQPILGFNYGARNYDRVKKTYKAEILIATVLSSVVWLLFITMPELIVGIFGDEDAMFNQFAAIALSTYMGAVFCAGFQIPSANFFQAIGKPLRAMTLSMSRQVIILIPLMLLLPLRFGLDGILYSMPVTDIIALVITLFFVTREVRNMGKEPAAQATPSEA